MAFSIDEQNTQEPPKPEGIGDAEGGDDTLLEYLHNDVTDGIPLPPRYEVAKCGCRCWYCLDCCKRRGYNLRAKLIPILETFTDLMMITLTIDPDLFQSQKQAYLHIGKNRCISKFMQTLDRRGHLHSRRYFYVLEFQKSGNPHYHILIDTGNVPHDELQAAWDKSRPNHMPPPLPGRPGFGWTYFSKGSFNGDAYHAACYATKYLIKAPEQGWPSWVLKFGKTKRVARYGVSRGFWNEPKQESKNNTKPKARRESVSYEAKMADCGSNSDLFRVERVLMPDDNVQESRYWSARIGIATDVYPMIDDFYEDGSRRASIRVQKREDAIGAIRKSVGRDVHVIAIAKSEGVPNAQI